VSTRACNLSEAEVSKTASEAAPFRSYSYQKLELQKLTETKKKLARGISKEIFVAGKEKLAYFAGVKDLFTHY
jgi:hypothetical protein